ncbi:MAG: hypothetical protein FP823_16155 [Rhodoferax sp.]|nr:hypothetical protein [Rhodoferax sp.]
MGQPIGQVVVGLNRLKLRVSDIRIKLPFTAATAAVATRHRRQSHRFGSSLNTHLQFVVAVFRSMMGRKFLGNQAGNCGLAWVLRLIFGVTLGLMRLKHLSATSMSFLSRQHWAH